MLSEETKRDLVQTTHATLDGEPAAICGARCAYATVVGLNTGRRFEWAWEPVLRIVAAGGEFRS